jgi:hypothetical protein
MAWCFYKARDHDIFSCIAVCATLAINTSDIIPKCVATESPLHATIDHRTACKALIQHNAWRATHTWTTCATVGQSVTGLCLLECEPDRECLLRRCARLRRSTRIAPEKVVVTMPYLKGTIEEMVYVEIYYGDLRRP